MRKLLAGFLLTLRWLLVLLLPVLGLISGLLLMPEVTPKWEQVFDEGKCAGITFIDGQPRVIIHGDRSFYMGLPAIDIISLDLTTGEKVYTWKINVGERTRIELLPGTTLAVYQNRILLNSHITATDWRTRFDLGHGKIPDGLVVLNSISYRNHVMVADLFSSQEGGIGRAIGIWRLEEDQLVEPKMITISGTSLDDIHLCSTGDWAVISHSSIGPLANKTQVEMIDIRQGKIVQRLSDDIETVCWLPDEVSFLALHRDQTRQTAYLQRYDYINGTFTAVGPMKKAKSNGIVRSPDMNPYVIMASRSIYHPVRIKLIEWLGKFGKSILDRCWPGTTTIDLISTSNGELLQSTSIPDFGLLKSLIHPDPNGQGFVVQSGNIIRYWEFPSNTHWQPYLGLAIGITLASLLAWRNLRRNATRAKTAYSASSSRRNSHVRFIQDTI